MKKIIYIAVALFSIGFTQCTKRTKDFTFSVNPVVFDHTVTMMFYDGKDPSKAPPGLKVTISGDAANDVYEFSGTKNYSVVDGILSLGLLPAANPSEGKAANFTVTASAPGYLTTSTPVSIVVGQPTKLVNVSMINTAEPPAGVNVNQSNTGLAGNQTPTPVVVETTPAAPGDQTVAVDIPAGTSFKDAAGNTITGATLTSTVISFSTNSAASVSAFPGGTVSSNIIGQNGSPATGRFQTAGFASITMEVGTTTVKTFSQDITLHMSLNADQKNPSNNQPFAAGQTFPVWSYQTETGQWKFEKMGDIVDDGSGGLEVAFTTNHLTYYNLAILDNICATSSIIFNTGLPSAETFMIDVYAENNPTIPVIAGYLIQVADNGTVNLQDVPQGNMNVKVYRNTAGNSQTNYMIRETAIGSYSGALCGTTPTIALSIPTLTPITFDIQGQCPSNSQNPIVRPTVDVWYRTTGSNSAYSLLGQVQQGFFSTTNLTVGTTYDFKVVWNGSQVFLKTRNVDSTSYNRTIVVPQQYQSTFCN